LRRKGLKPLYAVEKNRTYGPENGVCVTSDADARLSSALPRPKTGYKRKERFRRKGLAGMEEESRRPKSSPEQLSEGGVCEIVRLKPAHTSSESRVTHPHDEADCKYLGKRFVCGSERCPPSAGRIRLRVIAYYHFAALSSGGMALTGHQQISTNFRPPETTLQNVHRMKNAALRHLPRGHCRSGSGLGSN